MSPLAGDTVRGNGDIYQNNRCRVGRNFLVAIRLVCDLSENITMLDPRDIRAQVELAVEAERVGFDGVMVSDHVVMGKGADSNGLPMNPREFVMPGMQHPSTPWPSNIVLMSAVAAATSRVRIMGAAVIAPLRHPLALAKELGTIDLLSRGRLVVLPTTSWHKAEYDALGVSYEQRGEILDEQLEIMSAAWAGSPTSFHGKHFNFDDVWLEPKAFRPTGPMMWFGGASPHKKLLERLVRYGNGYLPMGPMSDEDKAKIVNAVSAAGRKFSDLEFVGGIPGMFKDATSCGNVDESLGVLPPQIRFGARTFVVKPSQFVNDLASFPAFGRELLEKANRIAGEIKPEELQ
jgi:probable F420-dependent oxidoreductase